MERPISGGVGQGQAPCTGISPFRGIDPDHWRFAKSLASPRCVDSLEIVAALLGVINILLLARRSVWNYAFGLAMVILYAPIFFQKHLYADATLQVFFAVAQIYGLWNWWRSQAETGEVKVERLGLSSALGWALLMLACIAVWGKRLAHTDDTFPYLDATTAMVSIVAQILLSKRLIENWVLWIFVDVIQIGLYLAKGLVPTAILYVLLLIMSVWGWIEWTRAERRTQREILL